MKITVTMTVVFESDIGVEDTVAGIIDCLGDHRWRKFPFAMVDNNEITMLPELGCAVDGKEWEEGDTDGKM